MSVAFSFSSFSILSVVLLFTRIMGSSNTTELWAEYGIGMGFFLLRFFARFKVVGLRELAWDDLFSFIAMVYSPYSFYVLSADATKRSDIMDC